MGNSFQSHDVEKTKKTNGEKLLCPLSKIGRGASDRFSRLKRLRGRMFVKSHESTKVGEPKPLLSQTKTGEAGKGVYTRNTVFVRIGLMNQPNSLVSRCFQLGKKVNKVKIPQSKCQFKLQTCR